MKHYKIHTCVYVLTWSLQRVLVFKTSFRVDITSEVVAFITSSSLLYGLSCINNKVTAWLKRIIIHRNKIIHPDSKKRKKLKAAMAYLEMIDFHHKRILAYLQKRGIPNFQNYSASESYIIVSRFPDWISLVIKDNNLDSGVSFWHPIYIFWKRKRQTPSKFRHPIYISSNSYGLKCTKKFPLNQNVSCLGIPCFSKYTASKKVQLTISVIRRRRWPTSITCSPSILVIWFAKFK